MNIIFFGSSKYSTIVQKALFEKFGLSLTVTIPDKPVGRKQILTPSPVKKLAIENSVPVLTFDKLDKKALEQFSNETMKQFNNGVDFLVVSDYGLILPKELLDLPKFAPLNVHHSLLPKYRGPSPAPTAILNGDKVSGVTIIKMTEKMDAGSILSQKEYTLVKDETTDSLLTKLNTLGAELLLGVIENFDRIKPIPQNEQKTTYTKKITKKDGFIDLDNPPSPEILDRKIRAFYPWPTVWTKMKLKVARLAAKRESGELKIIKLLPEQMIQVEGGKPMDIKDFINGYPEAKEKIEKLF